MALTTCADCQGPLSDSANACPKCGAPVRHTMRGGDYLQALALIVVVLGFLWFFAWRNG